MEGEKRKVKSGRWKAEGGKGKGKGESGKGKVKGGGGRIYHPASLPKANKKAGNHGLPASCFDKMTDTVLSQYPTNQIENDWDGDDSNTDEVDIDTSLDHLRNGDVSTRIDNGIRWC